MSYARLWDLGRRRGMVYSGSGQETETGCAITTQRRGN